MSKKPNQETLGDKFKKAVKKAPATSATIGLSILPGPQLLFLPLAVIYDLYRHEKTKGDAPSKPNKYDPRNK